MKDNCNKLTALKMILNFFDKNPEEWKSLMFTLKIWGVALILIVVVISCAVYFDEEIKKFILSHITSVQ